MAALSTLLLLAAPALAALPDQRRTEQMRVWEARRDGHLLPQQEIEARVVPTMRGAEYLGLDFDDGVYTLKFLRNGTVIWVEVDGRSGQIIGRTGR